ncbi:MAG TPA: hypothetical protein VLJ38_04230 [Polyangiaceae bacterium]|nr:hypothetical protein [Polyangiaceae bacterium]
MDSFETECRHLIDGLVRELVALISEVAGDELKRARVARAAAERAAAPRVSARLARALERAEERRRLAAERRAAALAQRPQKSRRAKAATGSTTLTSELVAEDQKSEAASPPPLFVHKRTRDGNIQKLERNVDDGAPPPAV